MGSSNLLGPTIIIHKTQGENKNLEKKSLPVNREIKSKRVVLIDASGTKLGLFLSTDAVNLAKQSNLDLVQVNTEEPPTCKIMDYGKYLYSQKKKTKSSTVEIKEIKISPNIDGHDFSFKFDQAKKFLAKGHKLKLTVKFDGREIIHKDLGFEKISKFIQELGDLAKVESAPVFSGKIIQAILTKN